MFAHGFGSLTTLLAIPLLGALALLFVPRRHTKALFVIALLATCGDFIWSLEILNRFDARLGDLQLIERVAWIPRFGIQ
jgi:NADH-quinone oxidoreductase subunit M